MYQQISVLEINILLFTEKLFNVNKAPFFYLGQDYDILLF